MSPRGISTYHQRFKTLEERFEERIERIPECGCWIWIGYCSPRGYGRLSWLGEKEYQAHRISWILHKGEIPKGLCVLHRCDTPSCVNPHHLFLGTVRENNIDRDRKGRQVARYGENSPGAKLTEDQVLNIRSSSKSQNQLARIYGVHQSTIWLIKAKRNWGRL